jgi:putative hydroxymethylpyrimidine transport system permease protein
MTGWRAGIAATCLVLVLWQTVIWTTGVARFILPPPALVAQTIWESRALLAEHAVVTMAEVLIGLLLGAALGFVSALWLGFGLWSKITMTIIIIYFPVTSSFFDALMRTNRDWIGLAKVMGASPARIMWHIRVPAALPGFASGLRLAAVYAPIGAIIGEWVGASKGLGYLMLLANGRAKTDLMFAALIVLAVLTILLHAAVNRLCEKTLDRPEVS